MSPEILTELLKLRALPSIPEGSDALRLPPELLDEMEERLAEHRADPSSAIPSDKARARLRKWT